MTSMQLDGAAGDRQFLVPFGAGSPMQWAGMFTQRYMAAVRHDRGGLRSPRRSRSGTTRR